MLENYRPGDIVGNPDAPFINRLMRSYGVEENYYGVTHVSLPNYVAAISGTTGGTHSDNPTQAFFQPTLIGQLARHHLGWQAVMQGLPYPGYTGYWYPDRGNSSAPWVPPSDALYAKKHDPFMLFPAIAHTAARHVVPLGMFGQELRSGNVPAFVWITPDLCHDMHGQAAGPGSACPESGTGRLVHNGDAFLATWVPKIMQSPAWSGNSVIFITWDEASLASGFISPAHVRAYLAAGPGAPPVFRGWPQLGTLGGGRVPLIVITRRGPHPMRVYVRSDHYSLLKTIEAAWRLGYLGHARSASVPVLWQFFSSRP